MTQATMLDYARNQLRQVLVSGLANPDSRERRASAAYIARQILPALRQTSQPEIRRTSLAVLSRLIMERRPPRDEFEDLGLDYAIMSFVEQSRRNAP